MTVELGRSVVVSNLPGFTAASSLYKYVIEIYHTHEWDRLTSSWSNGRCSCISSSPVKIQAGSKWWPLLHIIEYNIRAWSHIITSQDQGSNDSRFSSSD